MEFFFTRQQMELLSVFCDNHGTDGYKIRKILTDYKHVSLKGDEFEIMENVVNDILRKIKNVSDADFGAFLEREFGR